MKIPRTATMLAGIALVGLGSASAHASTNDASSYPNKMVRIVVPFSAGGGTSNAARFVADKLAEKWKQSVIIDNRPGGNTVIGSSLVAKADPDGYTLLFANTSHTINPSVMPSLPYDSIKGFTPIGTILVNRFVLLTHPSVPAKNFAEFTRYLKTDPESHNLPTVGAAGVGRLANESLMQMIGVKLQNIPYKGTSDLATNLMGGQLKFALEIPGFYLPHIRSGKLNALAVSGASRMPSLPTVPTFAEVGLPNFDTQSWYGLMAPAGTPKAIVNKIAADMKSVIESKDFQQFLDSIQSEAMIRSPEEFETMIKQEIEKHRETVKSVGISAAL